MELAANLQELEEFRQAELDLLKTEKRVQLWTLKWYDIKKQK